MIRGLQKREHAFSAIALAEADAPFFDIKVCIGFAELRFTPVLYMKCKKFSAPLVTSTGHPASPAEASAKAEG